MAETAGRVPDAATAFRVLARQLMDEGTLSTRAAVLLDFCGRAMGLTEEQRRELVQTPADWAPPPLAVLTLAERFLEDAPAEVRQDARAGLASLLGLESADGIPPPVCPVCKPRGPERAHLVWTPPPQTGLGGLEGIRHSTWSCVGCQTVLECIDEFDGSHRSRQMRIRVKGSDVQEFLRALRSAKRDPEKVTEVLVRAPFKPWLMERVWGATSEVWNALSNVRSRVQENPELTAEVYVQRHALARLGPPPSDANWVDLVDRADLEPTLLSRLASMPGAPGEVRRTLFHHANAEVRYQARQAPDIPSELLEEELRAQPGDEAFNPAGILAILDRNDVGVSTLSVALDSEDPHVLYRVLRHPSLNLILLEKVRRIRRGRTSGLCTPCRVLQVYAPLESRASSQLLGRTREALVRAMKDHRWRIREETAGPEAQPERLENGGLRVVLARVTQSRVLVFLPPPETRAAEDLLFERLVEEMGRMLLESLAQEVIEVTMNEAASYWEGRVLRLDDEAQTQGGHGLPACEGSEDPGRWLEFELFAAERALPHAGVPPDMPTPRLATRPPYVLEEAVDEPRVVIEADPPELG